jgi:hypothetical protein
VTGTKNRKRESPKASVRVLISKGHKHHEAKPNQPSSYGSASNAQIFASRQSALDFMDGLLTSVAAMSAASKPTGDLGSLFECFNLLNNLSKYDDRES